LTTEALIAEKPQSKKGNTQGSASDHGDY